MSELPERKVLKEMLLKLKAKIINSQKTFFNISLEFIENSPKKMTSLRESAMKMPEGEAKTTALFIMTLMNNWNQNLNAVNSYVTALVGDMNLYIDTLENYSTELDNTLTDIFDRAKKRAEEQYKKQIEQQEKLRKKEPSYRA